MPNSVGFEVEEVDLFQFADVPFTINAYFKDLSTNQVRTGETSNLKVLLAFEGNASSEFRCKEHHPNLLEVVSNTGIKNDGRATIVLKIKDVSMNHDQKRFVVYLEAYRAQGNDNIIAAITNPITTINYKLTMSEAYTVPYVWYKDEGAKDKCIKVTVKLINSNQEVVTNRRIPLSVNLIYSSGQVVQPNTVLALFHDKDNNKELSIGETGIENIKFRVNEVSRNHRKQLFHLLVAADTLSDPSLHDVSPVTSIAFEVKSKRSSDARKELPTSKGVDEDSSDEFVAAPTSLGRASLKETSTVVAPAAPLTKKTKTVNADVPVNTNSNSANINNGIPAANAKRTQQPSNENSLLGGVPQLNIPSPTPSALEELSLDTPFKALFSLADWTNVAARVLSEVSNHNEGNDVKDAMRQLIEAYPFRAQSCLQYLQQFLSIQEQHLLQQNTLIGALYQQQQGFFHSLESLNPVRSGNSSISPAASARTGPVQGTLSALPTPTTTSENGIDGVRQSTAKGSGKKRGLDSSKELASTSSSNSTASADLTASETMVNIIVAKRVALSEHTDDFGLPAYTTNTPNGVCLLGFYKEMFDASRDEKVWVFRPLQSYDIFNDNDINLTLIEEILDLLEQPRIVQDKLFFELRHFGDNLHRMRQEAFLKLSRIEQSKGSASVVFLDQLMQKGTK